MTLSVEEIIYRYCEGRLFPDPEYYNGRGNNLYDLNSQILEMVYQGVAGEVSPAAAKAFVNLVKNLKDTNAKSFLEGLYRLEKKGWRYADPVMRVRVEPAGEAAAPQKPPPPPVIDMTKPPEQQKAAPARMTEVLNAFKRSGSSFGHDKDVTADFLNAHKHEIDASLINTSFGG